jgi:hypothetical protein
MIGRAGGRKALGLVELAPARWLSARGHRLSYGGTRAYGRQNSID